MDVIFLCTYVSLWKSRARYYGRVVQVQGMWQTITNEGFAEAAGTPTIKGGVIRG